MKNVNCATCDQLVDLSNMHTDSIEIPADGALNEDYSVSHIGCFMLESETAENYMEWLDQALPGEREQAWVTAR